MAPPPLPPSPTSKRPHPQQQRSNSFRGRTAAPPPSEQRHLRRPRTHPDLLADARKGGVGGMSPPMPWRGNSSSSSSSSSGGGGEGGGRRTRVPAKVLVNVTVHGSLGPVQVMASTEGSVEELVAAAVRVYVKEGRRPQLTTTSFGLHYSQFSLECLEPQEKLIELGSRNFFLCPKSVSAAVGCSSSPPQSSAPPPPPPSSCSKEVDRGSTMPNSWLRFMVFVM